HFVASLLDTEGCLEEVASFLYPILALGFVPCETFSAFEEVFGALKTTSLSKAHIASMWSVKGGSSAKELENSKVCFSIPTRGIYGEVGLNTFRNAIGAYYLPYSSEYVALPSIDVVRKWFPMIEYKEEVSTKVTLRKSLLPPRWRLLMAHIIQCSGG
nr:hypothetical protein [Tanacetum cinerariifolium]